MAGYITYKDGTDDRFYTGRNFSDAEIRDVDSVQLDNTELEHVLTTMTNLPKANNKRIVTYFGEHAKFILANW